MASFPAQGTDVERLPQDLKLFLGWCQQHNREVLVVSRGELEMYVRHLETATPPMPSPPSSPA